jgi:DNA-directed RNA polymerase specialized sigma24 family protein
MKSVPRSKILIDIVPDAILMELADTSDEMPCVLTALQQLPDDLSMIISARFVASISIESVAALLHTSVRNIERRQALGLAVIKKMLRKDIIKLRKKPVGRDVTCKNKEHSTSLP